MRGENPGPENTADKGVAYALSHEFERRSVVPLTELEVTAYERCMGGATPEQVGVEARRQGVLVRGGDATTRAVLAEEQRIIQFARDGRGTCRPIAPDAFRRGKTDHLTLSAEQLAMVNHVLTSPDRVVLVRGAAGTGKTFAMTAAVGQIDRPVVVLAPSADASRGVLRQAGFADADTVARFLRDETMREKARGGVIWVDEAALMPVRDTAELFAAAEELDARVVLMGDPRQHRSVARDGNLFPVLQTFAGLPIAELTDIRRQSGTYKDAVAAIEAGDVLKGHDLFTGLGWVVQTPEEHHNAPLAAAYFAAVDTRRRGQDVTDRVLVVAPTHAEGREVTEVIRDGLKARGLLGEERDVSTLTNLQWSEPERADLPRYVGTEVLQYHNNGGTFRAGQRVPVASLKPGDRVGPATTFVAYQPGTLRVAVGDRIRITANGWTADRAHRVNNKALYTVAGFEPDGGLRLDNGWTLAPDFGHLTHGYCTTSISGQGKTVDRVLLAMGSESLGATNAAQFYTSASRARQQATFFTDVDPLTLREAIQKQDRRRSATELMAPARKPKARRKRFLDRCRDAYQSLRERAIGAIRGVQPEREMAHEQ